MKPTALVLWAFFMVFLASDAGIYCVGSYSFCGSAVCSLFEAGSRPAATRFLLSCQKKPGKEKARLADGFPAELTSRLQRFVQTTAGSMSSHMVCATLARAGLSSAVDLFKQALRRPPALSSS